MQASSAMHVVESFSNIPCGVDRGGVPGVPGVPDLVEQV